MPRTHGSRPSAQPVHVLDTVAGLGICTTHLESDTLKQMGAQAGGQYKVQLMGGGGWPGGVIESGESDSSYSSLGAADGY